MEIAWATLRLANDTRADLHALEIEALVDTGIPYLCIPEPVAAQLQLKDIDIREVTLAGGVQQVRYVSSVRIEMLNRVCVTGALVLGNQVVLGTIALEDMDLVVDPTTMRVCVDPRAPDIPRSLAK